MTRDEIINRASGLLGIPYVWGGITQAGLDCSAWLSQVWGVSRQTTDTLSSVARPIQKSELAPGDALNLPTWKDPSGSGHVRLFVGWANAQQTAVEVMEETASVGRSVRRVIAYDDRYTPMRLIGVESGQSTPPAPAQPPNAQPEQSPGVSSPATDATPTAGGWPFVLPDFKVDWPQWVSGLELPQGLTALGDAIGKSASQVAAPFVFGLNQVAGLLAFLGQVHIWERLGLVLLGVILLVLGLILFALSFVDRSTVVKAASLAA